MTCHASGKREKFRWPGRLSQRLVRFEMAICEKSALASGEGNIALEQHGPNGCLALEAQEGVGVVPGSRSRQFDDAQSGSVALFSLKTAHRPAIPRWRWRRWLQCVC